MAEQEVDVISHLIDVEHRAAVFTTEAQTEADRRIANARSKADEAFRAQYSKIVADEEAQFAQKTAELTKSYESAVSAYKTTVAAASKDEPAFVALLDKLLG